MNSAAPYRLICFPCSGGGANMYRHWQKRLENVEVCAVQLPGRERRMADAPIDNLGELVKQVMPAMESLLDKPYIVFGHSMGGLLGYEIVKQIQKCQLRLPKWLIVYAYRSPEIVNRNKTLHELSDNDFINELRHYGGTPKQVLDHDETMKLVLPTIRADFKIHEKYRFIDEFPVKCPITAIAGCDDNFVPIEDMTPWKNKTNNSFELKTIQAGHFLNPQAENQLLDSIQTRINDFIHEDILLAACGE